MATFTLYGQIFVDTLPRECSVGSEENVFIGIKHVPASRCPCALKCPEQNPDLILKRCDFHYPSNIQVPVKGLLL